MKFFDIMNAACQNVGIDFTERMYNQFMTYKSMIQEWNEKVNLTAITEDEEMVKKHFIDCIKCFNFSELRNVENIIDVGTGAGFPGIPISILGKDIKVSLLDSLNKRINFLNDVSTKLELNSVSTYHGRAEDYARKNEFREVYDVAISRAVANMTVLSELCLPFVKIDGYFVAMKGPSIEEELDDAKNAIGTLGGKVEKVIEVSIEETDLKHNLVIIRKIKKTPDVYPRKAGTAAKKPLK